MRTPRSPSKRIRACWFTINALIAGELAAANPIEPFESFNGNPLLLSVSPPSWQVGALAADTAASLSIQHTLSNSYLQHEADVELTAIDGETSLTTVGLRVTLPRQLEASLLLSWVSQDAGKLDDLIHDWHDWFGLPQGGRSGQTNNQFGYSYTDGGSSPLQLSAPVSALGDTRVGLSQTLRLRDQDWLIQSEIRLPTGNAGYLAGTEGWAGSVGAGTSGETTFLGFDTVWFGAGGLTWQADGENPLGYRQQNSMASLRLGVQWQLGQAWWLKTQLDSNTPGYSSELSELGGIPLQLTSGLTIKVSPHWLTDISFAEDLNPGVSADFSLSFRVKYLWIHN